MPKIATLNPLLAPNVVCPNCGDIIPPEVIKTPKGKVSDIRYTCVNPKSDCGWRMTASLQHVLGSGSEQPMKIVDVDAAREALTAEAEVAQQRENNLRELFGMLPRLKMLVTMLNAEERDALEKAQLAPAESGLVANSAKIPAADAGEAKGAAAEPAQPETAGT